jgi:hypothetical protein
MIKLSDQRNRDHQRKTYKLYFPNELEAESVTAWVRSISGTLRSSRSRLNGVPTVAFELWATSKGIEHRLLVPWQHADYVISQLRSLVPGIRVTPDEEYPHRLWTSAVEVGMTNSSRQLRIYDAGNTSASLLASVQALDADEAILVQWVATPAIPRKLPLQHTTRSDEFSPRMFTSGSNASRDEVNDRRGKLEEPNVMAVLRVAASASTEKRAAHLIYRVRSALASTRSPSTRFTKRFVTKSALQKRLDLASASMVFPIQLSAPEVAALVAWPIGNPFVSGLPQALARQLPATDQVPRVGRVIGRSNFPGNERPIAIDYTEARKHVHVVGPTGVGKTVLLGNMMRQDMASGYGVVLIESKGDLFHTALNYVPWDRLQDVVILSIEDTKHIVGFNVLDQGDPRLVVDEIVALFEYLYKDTRSVWTREVLYHALMTLINVPGLTFVDLAPLLVPMSSDEVKWADDVIRSLKDRELKNFWQRFQNQPKAAQDRITQPVMDRIWQLNARPEIRNIIGQSTSSFQMADIIRDNKILLVNLAGIPRDTASLTGTLLMNALWHAVKTTPSEKPTFLYLDEFQDFVRMPVDPEDMLAKARGFGLGMVLAHQHLGQLPTELRSAVLANGRTKIVFATTADDARVMAREFGNSVSEHDFMHLGKYEAISRVATGDGISSPLTITTAAPAPGHNFGNEAIQRSRQLYTVPAHEVEQAILKRRTPEAAPKTQRPSIGTDKSWGSDTPAA